MTFLENLGIHKEEKPKPIYIGLMGMTGVGKSSFIQKVTGDSDIKIGKGLKSCTQEIQPAKFDFFNEDDNRSYEVWLVDTPGYDDSNKSDTDTLLTFVKWLQLKETKDLQLSGLIYLHRITDDRIGGAAARNLDMMQRLVGEDNLANVVLVTSRWEMIDPEEGEVREKEYLLGPGGFWETMTMLGARNARYNNTNESAHAIIRSILSNSPIFLKIQEELKKGVGLQETAAGKALADQYEKIKKEQQEAIDRQQKRIEELQQMLDSTVLNDKQRQQHGILVLEQQKQLQETLQNLERTLNSERKLHEASQEQMAHQILDLQEKLHQSQRDRPCGIM